MTPDAFELLGLALAFIGGFALMVEWLESREKRRQAHHDRVIARILDLPSVARPRPWNRQDRARYALPPKSSDLLPWR